MNRLCSFCKAAQDESLLDAVLECDSVGLGQRLGKAKYVIDDVTLQVVYRLAYL